MEYFCPRCGSTTPTPRKTYNPYGSGYKMKCPKCHAEIISDELSNFLVRSS